MKKIFYILIATLTVTATSCDEVIDYDLNEGQEKVVIEGIITNGNPAIVKVTKTTNFYDNTPVPKVTDAIVTITDNTGATDTLIHKGDGVYVGSNITGVFDRTYVLKVVTNGQEYTAQSLLPRITPVDSIVYEYREQEGFFVDSGYYVTFYAKDPANEKNYYLGKYYRNDTLLVENNRIFLYDDRFVQENTSLPVEFEFTYQLGDKAKMEFYSLTKEAYDFYYQLMLQINNDGGFYSTPPANAKGNISNGALGLFQASGMVTDSLVIQ